MVGHNNKSADSVIILEVAILRARRVLGGSKRDLNHKERSVRREDERATSTTPQSR